VSIRELTDTPNLVFSSGQAGFSFLWLICGLLLCGFFFLAASRESLFLRPIVRAGFRLVVPTSVAVEEKDFLSGFSHDHHLWKTGKFSPTTIRKWFSGNDESIGSIVAPPRSTPSVSAFFKALLAVPSFHAFVFFPQIAKPVCASYLTSDGTSLLAKAGSPPVDGIDCGSPSTFQPSSRNPMHISSANQYASKSSCLYNTRTSPLGLSFKNVAKSLTSRLLMLRASNSSRALILSAASSALCPYQVSSATPARTANTATSIRRRFDGIMLPLSRPKRAAAKATSCAWVTSGSTWTIDDYKRRDKAEGVIALAFLVAVLVIAWFFTD
jgi:hypothetical protein